MRRIASCLLLCQVAEGFVPNQRNQGALFGIQERSQLKSPLHLHYATGSNVTDAPDVKQSPNIKFDHGIINPTSNDQYKVSPNGARITMVGSGPGSPDLLTVAAHRILTAPTTTLKNSDVPNKLIIADRLVAQEILDLCEGELRVARKYRGCAEMAQEEIYKWTEEGLAEGRHVVRLKIGDPFVFGRGGEEVLNFRQMGIEPTVIPVRSR
jgi:hypothetical protein